MLFLIVFTSGSISSTFYEQLLQAQIPKEQKDSQVVSLYFSFACAKAACKMLMKLTRGVYSDCLNKRYKNSKDILFL